MLVRARKQTNGPPGTDQGFSTAIKLQQPPRTVTQRCASTQPPVSPFLLAQNLSSKRIAPTDNMQPKSDDPKERHWWL